MKRLLKQIVLKYLAEETVIPDKHVQEKYRKSGLTEDQAMEIKRRIQIAFETDKIYRQNDLSLMQLAEHIDQDRYKISEVINRFHDKNFYSLLNSYRIAEAKALLINEPFLSVKAIMYEVGFNSKNSFYNAFKKDTGSSPNDFRLMGRFPAQLA
ncbi:MAG: AraC family transcriptional regulator [Flavobacteriaceae bacterium]|nr:AraC family transcriptional regulator [Flavobacteriaceae bacterium]